MRERRKMCDVTEIQGLFEWRIYGMRLLLPIAATAVENCEL
jgi:hypothetical protein